MIGFFPDPYPDELLYSASARYSDRLKYPNKQASVIEILGKRGLSAIVDFPSRLEYFVSILPPGNQYSVNELIGENTLLPFYEPFLPCDRAKLIRSEMKNNSKNNQLRSRIGTTVKQVKMPDYLRFCPLCAEGDKKEYGEKFWHRLHQLPGVLVCPVHLCFLTDSSIKWERGIGGQFYSAEKHILPEKPRMLKNTDPVHQNLVTLAENAKWLLSENRISVGTTVIRERYYNQLLAKELAYYNGRIRNNKLLEAFQKYFSPLLLEALGCSIKTSGRNWVFRLIEKGKVNMIHHPVRHLLMMTFLGLTAKEFFTSFREYKPFVDPPYPCLSSASDHYGELRIQKCEVFDNLTKGARRGKPIAIFNCDCKFTYQRIGPDKSEEDRFRYDSIREYGTVWEKKFEGMWNDLSLSRTEIARRLKISDLSVTNIAYRLNLPMNTEGTRISNDRTHCRNPRKTLSESRRLTREVWFKNLKENPEANRNKLIKLENFEYLWLMRNDRDWMEKHLPKAIRPPAIKEFLDWRKIDDEFSCEIEEVCRKIYNLPEKPIRVSLIEITRRVGNKNWIDTRRLKLPKTTEVVDKCLEPLEDYMIRKLKWAENKFIKERVIPTKFQLEKRAVIRNKTSENSSRIQREIDTSLKEITSRINYL